MDHITASTNDHYLEKGDKIDIGDGKPFKVIDSYENILTIAPWTRWDTVAAFLGRVCRRSLRTLSRVGHWIVEETYHEAPDRNTTGWN